MRVSFTKKIRDMFTRLAILCCHSVCGGEKMKSPCKSHAGKKRPKNVKDWVTERCMGRLVEKSDWCNSKASRGIALGPHKEMGGLTAPHMNPQL